METDSVSRAHLMKQMQELTELENLWDTYRAYTQDDAEVSS